jgi:hypothetical protein
VPTRCGARLFPNSTKRVVDCRPERAPIADLRPRPEPVSLVLTWQRSTCLRVADFGQSRLGGIGFFLGLRGKL